MRKEDLLSMPVMGRVSASEAGQIGKEACPEIEGKHAALAALTPPHSVMID